MLHWLRFLDLVSNLLWYSIINPFILLDTKDSHLAHKEIRDNQKMKKYGHN